VFIVSKEIEFDAGHRVPNHSSKCRNPHGHRYRVRVSISGDLVTEPGSSSEGMLADFGDLKQLLMDRVHDVYDHGFVIYAGDEIMKRVFAVAAKDAREMAELEFKVIVVPWIPTAENFARSIYNDVAIHVAKMGFKVYQVEVFETPTSRAVYSVV
jgi:6-pyruvoyltetrahydropterin/6-carboxytetrahydropterin synthase